MGTRGPKPDNHKLIQVPDFSEKRPKAPPGMTRKARSIWRRVIDSLPPTHFRPGDLPLLQGYCEALALRDEATQAIATEGAVVYRTKQEIGPDKKTIIETIVSSKANPWVAIQTQTNHTAMQLATKLRLCANSRKSNQVAATEKPEPKSSRKGLMFGGNKAK